MTPKQTDELSKLLADHLSDLFGRGCWDDSVDDTTRRWLKAIQEFRQPVSAPFTPTTFDSPGTDQMVICKDIHFSSLCAHHLFPFSGVAHIAYIPNQKIIGLSKIPRFVDWLTHKPSTQETSTEDIAKTLEELLNPIGVAVVLKAQHTCMACRGVRAHTASMVTSVMKGAFLTNPNAKQEFLSLITS